MAGVEIPDGLVYGLAPIALLSLIGLISWMVLLLWKITLRLHDHGSRLHHLEQRLGIEVAPREEPLSGEL